jgi:DNA replication protein DnaC
METEPSRRGCQRRGPKLGVDRSRHNSTARRLLREARFPDIKTLDQVDWTALKGISKPKLLELASCQFITAAESTIIAGPIGTGKTMLAIALGVEATRRRFRVLFTRAADLVQSLLEARDECTLTRLQQRYEKVALLIVDELGFVPFECALWSEPLGLDRSDARIWTRSLGHAYSF